MKMSYWALILTFIACVAGGLVWSANHYHGKFLEEQKRADAAEQRADSTEAITANVLRTMAITNIIQEANQHAKQQIALESQRTQEDIKVAVADDDCASRPVPAAAADRLRKYANSLRPGSGTRLRSGHGRRLSRPVPPPGRKPRRQGTPSPITSPFVIAGGSPLIMRWSAVTVCTG